MTDDNKALEEEQIIPDYTEWHRSLFEGMTVDEIIDEAVAFEEAHPYKGNGKRV